MVSLIWRRASDGAQLPAYFGLPRGKVVFMEGRNYTRGLPSHFDVYRVDSPFIRECKRLLGKDGRKHIFGDTWEAHRVDDQKARSEPLPLKARSRFSAHRWQFTDGDLWSPPVRTVRFADNRIGGWVGAGAPHFPVSGGLKFETAVPEDLDDPAVAVSMVLPWRTSEQELTVRDVLADELLHDSEISENEELLSSVLDVAHDYLPSEPTVEWEFSVEQNILEIEPGERVPSMVNVKAMGPGKIALAISVTNIKNPDERAVSEVVVLEIDENGIATLLCVDG